MSRKKRPNVRQTKGRATVADPRKQGMRAFSASSFDAAIRCWSELDQRDAQVKAALAEAYFRRALEQKESASQIADLREAIGRVPDEQRYQYHLGMALHRAGDLAAAIKSYKAVLEHNPRWSGARLLLVLAELEHNPKADIASLKDSTPEIAAILKPVQMLLQGETPPLDSSGDPLQNLWHGLGLIPKGDGSALAPLSDDKSLPSAKAIAVRRLYKGTAAAQADDMDTAVKMWQRAYEDAAWVPDWLSENLAAVMLERLQALLKDESEQQLDEAAELASYAVRASIRHNALNPLLVTTLDRAAQQDARRGNWQRAVLLWEHAREVVGGSSALGSPRLLLHNLAIAYEMQEQWVKAAEMWRALLRTRPRKTQTSEEELAADPLAYSDAEWAWVRKRVITCYKQAGEPGEAVKVFRSAIKSDPKDLDMRLQLADALLANNQEQASLNELDRILEIDRTYIEAYLRQAEIHSASGYWRAAEHALRHALDLQPERDDIRRQVGRLLLTRGNYLHNSFMLNEAERTFKEGQKLVPDDYQFPLNLARVAIDRDDMKKAGKLLDESLELAGDNPKAYVFVIDCWAVAEELDKARAVLERAQRELTLTVDFYIELAGVLLSHNMQPPPMFGPPEPPKPVEGPWLTLAQEAVDQAVALKPDDPRVRYQLTVELLPYNPEMALEHAQAGADMSPDDPGGLFLLGFVQGINEMDKEAKATLRSAARMARKQGKHDLAEQADAVRQQVGSPFFRLSLQMGMMGGFDDMDEGDPFF